MPNNCKKDLFLFFIWLPGHGYSKANQAYPGLKVIEALISLCKSVFIAFFRVKFDQRK